MLGSDDEKASTRAATHLSAGARGRSSGAVRRADAASKTKFANIVQVRHRDEVEAPLTDWMREAYEFNAAPPQKKTPPTKKPPLKKKSRRGQKTTKKTTKRQA